MSGGGGEPTVLDDRPMCFVEGPFPPTRTQRFSFPVSVRFRGDVDVSWQPVEVSTQETLGKRTAGQDSTSCKRQHSDTAVACGIEASIRTLNLMTDVREVDLGDLYLDDASAVTVLRRLAEMPALRVLRIAGATLEQPGVDALGALLERTKSLRKINMTGVCVRGDPTPITTALQKKEIIDEFEFVWQQMPRSMWPVLSALSRMPHVDISCSQNVTAVAIEGLIERHSRDGYVWLPRVLIMDGCLFRDDPDSALGVLFRAILLSRGFVKLSLRGIKLTDAAVQAMCGMILDLSRSSTPPTFELDLTNSGPIRREQFEDVCSRTHLHGQTTKPLVTIVGAGFTTPMWKCDSVAFAACFA